MAVNGVDAICFLPVALDANMIKFDQARVNGGRDVLEVAKCFVI